MIELEHVAKIFPGQRDARGRRPEPRRARGRDRGAHRPVGLRQVDDAADDQPAHRADVGRITVAGKDVAAQKPHELRLSIGYVIQQVGLFPHRTIARNIATVPELLGWDRARTNARVEELMELVGLDAELASRYPTELSGGQQQRVGVARGARRRPAGAADGRAVRRGRSDRAAAPAGGARRPAAPAAQDDRVRDARPRRGDASRRPHGRAQRRRGARAVRGAGRRARRTGRATSSSSSSAPTAGSSGSR